MSKQNNVSTSTSLFTTLLLVAFIVLKLCKVISWSWWWVLSPFWITFVIGLILLIIIIILKMKEEKKPKPMYKSQWQERYEEMLKNHQKLKN